MEEVKHYQVNGKYRMVYERSAVKGQDGFKVEANDDDIETVMCESFRLYEDAKTKTVPTSSPVFTPPIDKFDK